MPLRLKMPTGERVIINGAVLENAGDATTLVVHNFADVLRRKEVMQENDANTPAKRAIFALQSAYIFEADRAKFLEKFVELLREYVDAAPSAANIGFEILNETRDGQLYKALRVAHKLIDHEDELFKAVDHIVE